MPPRIMGARVCWGGTAVSEPARARFASAHDPLGKGTTRASGCDAVLLVASDEPAGWRPASLQDGSLLLFSGHIDNRTGLGEQLGPRHSTDWELYAAAYQAWGEAADLRVIGRFATIMVSPDGRDVRLSRSPVAAPPLHYHWQPKRLIVSSLANAVFATGEVERRIDTEKIADALFWNYEETDRSWHSGVKRLPSGHTARIGPDGVTTRSYYTLLDVPEVRLSSDDEYAEAALSLLQEGVRQSLRPDERPAISLSGGYDSQAVAALTARSRADLPLDTYTGVPLEGWNPSQLSQLSFGDERPHVEALAAMYPQIRPHWISEPDLMFDHRLQDMFHLSSGPPRNAFNLHWIHGAMAAASRDGADVFLTGDAGNAGFSFEGAGVLAGFARSGHWRRLWREARIMAARKNGSALRTVLTQGLLPLAPDWLHEVVTRAAGRDASPYTSQSALKQEYATASGVLDRARKAGHHLRYRTPGSSRRIRVEMLLSGSEDGADINQAMALLHGIEIRDPTSYRPLLEFCLAIPDDQYLRDGTPRWLARRMLDGIVPAQVIAETRRGAQAVDFPVRLAARHASLLAEIEELAAEPRFAEMFDLDRLRSELAEWSPGVVMTSETSSTLLLALTSALTFARFIRFTESEGKADRMLAP
ncbi:MAG: hypothetical protein KDE55_00970 [Novosphingobium sp.]|nr:hypothetical protein [Novosphingobium sp.]